VGCEERSIKARAGNRAWVNKHQQQNELDKVILSCLADGALVALHAVVDSFPDLRPDVKLRRQGWVEPTVDNRPENNAGHTIGETTDLKA
jgi:hypothetical protein